MSRFKRTMLGILASFLLILPVSQILLPVAAHADAAAAEPCTFDKSGSTFLAFPTWYKYMKGELIGPEGAKKCTPVINEISDTLPVLIAVVEILLRLIGVISVFFVVFGAIRYIMSQGVPDATTSARQTIVNAMIGVAISIVAAAAVSFFGRSIT